MKIPAGILLICMLFTSCVKNNDKCTFPTIENTAPQNEKDALRQYLQTNSIPFTEDPHGFFYNIVTPGSGAIIANLCSTVTVTYVGKLQNRTIFDQTAAGAQANFQLGSVIYGWQKGLPLIAKNGRILLYLPPTLGYGSVAVRDAGGAIVIPANSNLFFDITIANIQ